MLIQHLEHDRVGRHEGPKRARRTEHQHSAERQSSVDSPEAQCGQEVAIGESGKGGVAPGPGKAPETIEFGNVEGDGRQFGQGERRQVLQPQQGRTRLDFVRQHRKTLRLAVHIDRAADIPSGGGRNKRLGLRYANDHDIEIVQPLHRDGDGQRGRGIVRNQRLKSATLGLMTVTGSGSDHLAVVLDP